MIEAHSKGIEVFLMTTLNVFTTIQELRQLLAQFGIPECVVSDNGTQFAAEEFESFFYRKNRIR